MESNILKMSKNEKVPKVLNIASLANRKCYTKLIDAVENGANINAVDTSGNTALHIAISNSTFKNVKYLVEKGINIHLKNDFGDTALMYACKGSYKKYYEIIKLLIEHGVNINEKNKYAETAIILAYDTRIMKLLVEHGAIINPNALSEILISNVFVPNIEKIKFLVEHGANVNSEDEYGETFIYKCIDTLMYFKEYNYIPTLPSLFGSPNIPVSVDYGINELLEIIKYLISKGADIYLFTTAGCRLGRFEEIKPYIMKIYNEYMFEKSKERSDILREGLIQKYMSPENIEQWSMYYNKPFDEVIEIM